MHTHTHMILSWSLSYILGTDCFMILDTFELGITVFGVPMKSLGVLLALISTNKISHKTSLSFILIPANIPKSEKKDHLFINIFVSLIYVIVSLECNLFLYLSLFLLGILHYTIKVMIKARELSLQSSPWAPPVH